MTKRWSDLYFSDEETDETEEEMLRRAFVMPLEGEPAFETGFNMITNRFRLQTL